MTQLQLGGLGGIVLAPAALDEQRGAWCSPLSITAAVGAFDLDPFTNPRSTLVARHTCMLERGDDGFGLDSREMRGSFHVNPVFCTATPVDGRCDACGYFMAGKQHTVWIQPPYDIVQQALDHYEHTRFTALLRFDPSTAWFAWLWERVQVIMVPRQDRLEFVPPPGVKASSNPFPHGLFYRLAADVPAAVRALCLTWPTPSYPWIDDPLSVIR